MTEKKPTKPGIPAALDSLQANPALEAMRRAQSILPTNPALEAVRRAQPILPTNPALEAVRRAQEPMRPLLQALRPINEAQQEADRLIDLFENDPIEFLKSPAISPLTVLFLLEKKGNQEIQDKVIEIIKEEKSRQAKARVEARYNKPGGNREKQEKIRQIWASGKYDSRDRCAEEESRELGMSFSAARKALRNIPDPTAKG